MARRKSQSIGEVLIGYFAVATEADSRALLTTANAIVHARFPPPAKVTKKPVRGRRPGPVASVLGGAAVSTTTPVTTPTPAAVSEPAKSVKEPMTGTRGPGRGRRPPIDPALPPPADVQLPDQGDPADAEA